VNAPGAAAPEDRTGGRAPLTALHVNWTSPHRHGLERLRGRVKDPAYRLPAAELVTLVHGVLAWRAFHGPVELVTDTPGATYAKEQGLDALYDRVDTSLDELESVDLDPLVYSTGAKIVAAGGRPAPFAILDTDLYLRRPLELDPHDGFVFAHWETADGEVYPPVDRVPNLAGADLSPWVFDTPAANMAISVFLDEEHRAAYTAAATAYAVGNSGPADAHPVVRAVFAEQRLAPAVARALGVDVRPVSERTWLTATREWDGPDHAPLFHHTWTFKDDLRKIPELQPAYLRFLLEELLWRFPAAREVLDRTPDLAGHADLVAHTAADLAAHGPSTLGAPA
jgi:hypothetical protein